MDQIQTLVGKAAVTAATADTDAQSLVGQKAGDFFRMAVDQTVLAKRVRLMPVNGPWYEFDQISSSPKTAVGLAETATIAGTGDESSVAFAKRRLTPDSVRQYIPISQHRLQFTNIARDRIDDVVIDLLATDYGNAIEEIGVKSANGGANPVGAGTGYLSVLDGWRALANSANIYDHNGGYYNSLLFRKLWNTIPSKWRTKYADKRQWAFLVHDECPADLQDLYAQRSTPLGDRLLEGPERVETIFNIPMLPVPFIPDALDGILLKSGTAASYTWVMLTRLENMYIGFRPKVRVFLHPNEEGNILHVSLWGEYAYQFENIEEVAIAVNVTNNVSYT